MLDITEITLKEYTKFSDGIYSNDRNYKDNKKGTMNIVVSQNRSFYKNSRQKIIAVKEDGKILSSCVLIIHNNEKQVLSVAYFEALEHSEKAVNMLLQYAEQYGSDNGCEKIVIGLDGHINNGLAFATSNKSPSFGESYNPSYYNDYFKDYNPVKLVSFTENIKLVKQKINEDMEKFKSRKDKITLEFADFKNNFEGTMKRYTDLNNEIFPQHRYYFKREYQEDYELFDDMRPLLKNQNLIFAKCDGKDIGFVLWYPDFNELVKPKKGASVSTYIKYKILNQNPKSAKMVEIGVNRKYRLYGAILFLFNAALENVDKSVSEIFSSWILDENCSSKSITQRYVKNHYKDYMAYEKQL